VEDYAAWNQQSSVSIAQLFATRSERLRNSFMLGVLALSYVQTAKRNRVEAESTRGAAHRLLAKEPDLVAAFDRLVKAKSKPPTTDTEMLSPCLGFAVELLRELRPEPKTCFVAMPFKHPFETYYATFYSPSLIGAGYRPLRAWGGFGREDFSPLLVTMILKSGALLADLSRGNANVIWELGVAQGAAKSVFLIRHEKSKIISDLARHVAWPYSPGDEGWPEEAVRMLGVRVALQNAAIERSGRDPIRIAAGLRQVDIETTSTWLMDQFWEASFLGARKRGESDANAHLKRGLERLDEQRWAEAESDFTYAIENGGLLSSAYYGRGIASLQAQNYRSANLDFTAAMRQPGDIDAHYFRAVVRYNLRNFRASLEDLDTAAARPDADPQLFRLRALVYAYLGRLEECEIECKMATELSPSHFDTHGAWGMLLLARGEFAEASKRFRLARRAAFGNSWRFDAGLAELLNLSPKAANEYEKGLERASDADIHQALDDLRFWTRKFKATKRLAASIRSISTLLRSFPKRAW